ncbi:MAG: T9SS type A sorting domain-containing protein [Hyphomicrobiales bacterium]
MNKIYYLGLMFLISIVSLGAKADNKIYIDDDFTNGLQGWTTEKLEGSDNDGWEISSNSNNEGYAIHRNYSQNSNDRLISSSFLVEEDVFRVEFDDYNYQDQYSGEHGLYVAELVNNELTNFTKVKEFNEITNGQWIRREVNIEGYKDKRVSIVFYNSGSPGMGWSVDNVKVYEPDERKLEIVSCKREGVYLRDKQQQFLVEVKNLGSKTEQEVDVNIKIGEAYTKTRQISLNPLETKVVKFDDYILNGAFNGEAYASIEDAQTYQTEKKAIVGGELPSSNVAYAIKSTKKDGIIDKIQLSLIDLGNYPNLWVVKTMNDLFGEKNLINYVPLNDQQLFLYCIDPDAIESRTDFNSFYKLNLENGVITKVCDFGRHMIYSMNYDPVEDKIYAISFVGSDAILLSIDYKNGEITEHASVSTTSGDNKYPFHLAIDRNGEKYVLANDKNIYHLQDVDNLSWNDCITSEVLNVNLEFANMTFNADDNALYVINTRNEDNNNTITKLNLETKETSIIASYNRRDSFSAIKFPYNLTGNTLSLRVLYNGTPVSNATLYLNNLKLVTDDNGRCSYHFLNEGAYKVKVVTEDVEKSIDITMTDEDHSMDLEIGNVGIEDDSKPVSIKIAPNPAKNYIQIKGLKSPKAVVTIYNLMGNKVVKLGYTDVKGKQISVEDLDEGTYIVELKQSGKFYISKLVIE